VDEQMIALGRRAVACKGWRWMAGMRWEAPNHGTDGRLEDWEAPTWGAHRGEDDTAPDLTDPATLGCLLALVREAWGDPTVRTSYVTGTYPHRWVVLRHGLLGWKTKAHGDTESEALVAALEAAP
jgi:hypothetical protein